MKAWIVAIKSNINSKNWKDLTKFLHFGHFFELFSCHLFSRDSVANLSSQILLKMDHIGPFLPLNLVLGHLTSLKLAFSSTLKQVKRIL